MILANELKNKTNDELYNLLLPVIYDIYPKYKNKLSMCEYKVIVLNTIDEILNYIKDSDNLSEVFKNKLIYNLSFNKELSGTNSLNDYLKEISIYPLLSEKEEKEEFLKFKEGDLQAKERIINSNLRLVVYVAKMYMNRGLPLNDLIQEGNIGLLKAVDMFSLDKECKFSTYAFWWIKQAMTRSLADKARVIRLPVHMVEALNTYKRVIVNLTDELHRIPTKEEIANEMGISIERLLEIEKNNYDILSLSLPVGDDKDTELGYLIPSTDKTPDEETFSKLLPEDVSNTLKNCNLKDRELLVILYRFGFYNDRIYTLEEIGKMYNITRERVRQIEKMALRKLKKSSDFRKMASWISDDDHDEKSSFYRSSDISKSKNFYEIYSEFKKEDVDYILNRLNKDEQLLFRLRFGVNLNEINYNSLSNNDVNKLYVVVIPKLRKMLYTRESLKNKINFSSYKEINEKKKVLK